METQPFVENQPKLGTFFISDITCFFLLRNILEKYSPQCFNPLVVKQQATPMARGLAVGLKKVFNNCIRENKMTWETIAYDQVGGGAAARLGGTDR